MLCILFLTSKYFFIYWSSPRCWFRTTFNYIKAARSFQIQNISKNYYLLYFISTLEITLTSMFFMPLASIQKKRNENSFRKFSDKRQRKRISDVLKDITNIDLSLGTENQESPTSTIFPDTEFGGLLSDFLLLICNHSFLC